MGGLPDYSEVQRLESSVVDSSFALEDLYPVAAIWFTKRSAPSMKALEGQAVMKRIWQVATGFSNRAEG